MIDLDFLIDLFTGVVAFVGALFLGIVLVMLILRLIIIPLWGLLFG